ncbi:Protein disulfide-isomerase [Melia azedarach]|uniref:Protein disulfide-isomerase n=1 Tax=Melia azedarach TaxID=155640 RepID=A0ACC1YB58_MELAZ|nr:Protein disulfide-isomerase [Melia azedarach]
MNPMKNMILYTSISPKVTGRKAAPEFAAVATELKGLAALAKFDADKEKELPEKNEVSWYPTFYLFIEGLFGMAYPGPTSRDSITIWMKRNIGVYVPTITTKNEAYDVLSVEYKLTRFFGLIERGNDQKYKYSQFGGQFTRTATADFVFKNKPRSVTTFAGDNARVLFLSQAKQDCIMEI